MQYNLYCYIKDGLNNIMNIVFGFSLEFKDCDDTIYIWSELPTHKYITKKRMCIIKKIFKV